MKNSKADGLFRFPVENKRRKCNYINNYVTLWLNKLYGLINSISLFSCHFQYFFSEVQEFILEGVGQMVFGWLRNIDELVWLREIEPKPNSHANQDLGAVWRKRKPKNKKESSWEQEKGKGGTKEGKEKESKQGKRNVRKGSEKTGHHASSFSLSSSLEISLWWKAWFTFTLSLSLHRESLKIESITMNLIKLKKSTYASYYLLKWNKEKKVVIACAKFGNIILSTIFLISYH